MTLAVLLTGVPTTAVAEVLLKQGDILVAEPGVPAVSVIDAATGTKTTISEGGLLWPPHRTVGVAMAPDGNVIAVRRTLGLIRVNPATGDQTVLSEGGLFRDPWAIAVDRDTGDIYVVDSGYDNDRPEINEAGRIIRVNASTGTQELIAAGSPCTIFPPGEACQNTTSAGAYLAHPYGIAIDYTTSPRTLVVADMSAFNGQGAIIRIVPVPGGAQTLIWGPASASPPPQVAQTWPLGCPMGVAVEPTGNLLTTVFTYPVPLAPLFPSPAGTFYGCAPPGIFRIDLAQNVQTVVNTNAPTWEPERAYAVGEVVRDEMLEQVHRVVTAGVSQSTTPNWNGTSQGTTTDGSVVWQNIGLAANWLIPFGVAIEPAPTPSDPAGYSIIVGEEGYSMVFRLDPAGNIVSAPLAGNTYSVTSVDVIGFAPPNGQPLRTNAQPTGSLAAGTTQTTLSLTTDVNATCRYSLQPGVPYASMTETFASTGSTAHATVVGGLANGHSYQFYVRCASAPANANTDDLPIAFTVSSASAIVTTFAGTESPLTEGGLWDSPGAWADLAKINGAYTDDLNAQGRLVSPAMAADQYAEITYDQDPGFASWVGVTTRTQGPTNGGGYLAIAYFGEIRLYRADDVGGLSFTLLASAAADIGNAPRRLRLESQGNIHRVYFNGLPVITYTDSEAVYESGQPGFAASVFGGPLVKILSFEAGNIGDAAADATPPTRFNQQPAEVLPLGTTEATLGLTTSEPATCRYSVQPGVTYAAMADTFTSTGGTTTHTTNVGGLANGQSYQFYVRCADAAANANTDDFVITVTVASSAAITSTFSGTESPLVEGGLWDSPGSWADLEKSNGAYAAGLNAQGRLTAPAMGTNQYAEITYDQAPGSASWVGVTTRTQGATNGSGYLAIAYAGEVRLYRTDDLGGLYFTLLASSAADIGAAPRRLRLESQGNTHRVYLNGSQVISHTATGTVYTGGQPGLAASVFGGPQITILSFEAGSL
jgi:hypothetical protein